MKRALVLVILFMAFKYTVQAQDQAKITRIKFLMSLMHQDSMMSKMAPTMSSYFTKTMNNLNKENMIDMPTIDSASMAQAMEPYMKNFKQKMDDEMVISYDKHFTSGEIEDFIVFYQSKSGQKMLMVMPVITKELMMTMSAPSQSMIQNIINNN